MKYSISAVTDVICLGICERFGGVPDNESYERILLSWLDSDSRDSGRW